MPSTRGGGRHDLAEGYDLSDDEYDPDYRESDSESPDEDDLPKTMQRDRAQWIVDNTDDLEYMFRQFLDHGRSIMGNAFFQTGNITTFANFVYRYTTPFSE